ncbi:hypothetical protein [Croceicoccus hydrothermalis]|nr:hypothetical protein [Croceicoccus hydrothermalis]
MSWSARAFAQVIAGLSGRVRPGIRAGETHAAIRMGEAARTITQAA